MKLNLGCGRATFPLDREKPAFADHLKPFFDVQFEPGWINVDKFGMPGVDESIDLFKFPWIRSSNGNPFNDDSADTIFISHLVEHVPHQVSCAVNLPPAMAARARKLVDELDGFFVFFAECWRVLKPGGLVYVHTPWPISTPGVADPSHTRQVFPASYGYLAGDNPEAPFDYHLPLRFELAQPLTMRYTNTDRMEPDWNERQLFSYALNTWDAADELRVVLRAVKER